MNKFKIVLKKSFFNNIKSPAFWTLLAMPLVMLLFGYFIFQQGNDNSQSKIAVISSQPKLAESFKKFERPDTLYISKYSTESAAKKALVKQKIDGYLKITLDNNHLKFTLWNTNQSNEINIAALQMAINQINLILQTESLKLSPLAVQQITTTPKLDQKTSIVKNNHLVTQNQNKIMTKATIVMGISFLLFFLLVCFMSQIANTIGREKGERVMEIILSSTETKWHFLGEVGGIFLTMLSVVTVYFLIAIVVVLKFHQKVFFKNMFPGLTWQLFLSPEIIFTILFGLTGAFLYLVLAATLGALVNNVEQVSQAIIPLMIPAMISYVLMIGSFIKITPFVRICAYIPLISNSLMPTMLVMGKASELQAIISYLICLGFTILMSYFSIGMYRSNVLVYSQKGIWSALKSALTFHKTIKVHS